MHHAHLALASGILSCDRTKAMPQELFAFVVSLYKHAISQGSVDAMNDLGALYYEMAASHGDEHAQENLGYCYYYGRDIPVNYERAFHYFAMGAFHGRLGSLYKIGDMYRKGYYVEKNPAEAFKIYVHCVGLMTHEDMSEFAGPVYLRLGQLCLYGEGTDKDPEEALKCFQIAERYLYDMVMSGELMYRGSLKAAIDGQAKARKILMKKLPSLRWPQE